MLKLRYFLFLLSLLSLMVLSSQWQESNASTKGTITLAPSLIDVTLHEASSEADFTFSLTNNGDKPVSLEIFPIDFKQKDEYGRIALMQQNQGSYSYSLSSFLQFQTNTLNLQPGEKKIVTATAINRQDLSPGGHYAAVVARLNQESSGTSVSPAVSALVFLRKTGGERFNLSLKDVEWPKQAVSLTYEHLIHLLFQNEGNVHLVPYGRVEIRDSFGRMLYKGVINSPSDKVFPESRRYISVELKKQAQSFPISFNTMTIKGTDSLQKVTYQYQTTFIYLHPVLLLGLGSLLVLFLLRRRRKGRK